MEEKRLTEEEYQKELKKTMETIKDAIRTLKAKSTGFESFEKSLFCNAGCTACNASCIARSPCTDYGCPNTCIVIAEA